MQAREGFFEESRIRKEGALLAVLIYADYVEVLPKGPARN